MFPRNVTGLIATSLLAGCSLITSLDGLAVETAEAGDAEAGDAETGNAETGDAEPGRDATPETGSRAPDASTCSALLCDDFEWTTGSGPWDEELSVPGSSVATETARARGGARSARFQIGAANDSATKLVKRIGPQGNVTLVYWLYVEPSIADRAIVVANIRHVTETRHLDFKAFIDGNTRIAVKEHESAAGVDTVIGSTPLIKGRWVEVALDLDRSAVPWRGSFRYDGVTVVDRVTLARSVTAAGAEHSAEIGCEWASVGTATYLDIDDARVEITP